MREYEHHLYTDVLMHNQGSVPFRSNFKCICHVYLLLYLLNVLQFILMVMRLISTVKNF